MTNVLATHNLQAGYRNQAVVHDLNIEVKRGEIISLLGANGAGKTTTLQTVAGDLKPISGQVELFGHSTTAPLYQRIRQGVGYITDERSLIFGLSTRDNLCLRGNLVEPALKLFPELEPLLDRQAGLLSGGQQQMVSMARCLASQPRLIIADELSMGLAPQIVDRLLSALRNSANQGLAVLLVEQHINKALACCDRGYVMRHGRIVLEGSRNELQANIESIEKAYISSDNL
jgi:branched-chain amino acid transport system ATP-binding protein